MAAGSFCKSSTEGGLPLVAKTGHPAHALAYGWLAGWLTGCWPGLAWLGWPRCVPGLDLLLAWPGQAGCWLLVAGCWLLGGEPWCFSPGFFNNNNIGRRVSFVPKNRGRIVRFVGAKRTIMKKVANGAPRTAFWSKASHHSQQGLCDRFLQGLRRPYKGLKRPLKGPYTRKLGNWLKAQIRLQI